MSNERVPEDEDFEITQPIWKTLLDRLTRRALPSSKSEHHSTHVSIGVLSIGAKLRNLLVNTAKGVQHVFSPRQDSTPQHTLPAVVVGRW